MYLKGGPPGRSCAIWVAGLAHVDTTVFGEGLEDLDLAPHDRTACRRIALAVAGPGQVYTRVEENLDALGMGCGEQGATTEG